MGHMLSSKSGIPHTRRVARRVFLNLTSVRFECVLFTSGRWECTKKPGVDINLAVLSLVAWPISYVKPKSICLFDLRSLIQQSLERHSINISIVHTRMAIGVTRELLARYL